jgi:hypothetical protein
LLTPGTCPIADATLCLLLTAPCCILASCRVHVCNSKGLTYSLDMLLSIERHKSWMATPNGMPIMIMLTKVPFPMCEMAIIDHCEFINLNRIADWVVCANNPALPHSPHLAEKKKNWKEKERATAGNALFGPDPRIPPPIQHSAAYRLSLQPLLQKYGVWIDVCVMELD